MRRNSAKNFTFRDYVRLSISILEGIIDLTRLRRGFFDWQVNSGKFAWRFRLFSTIIKSPRFLFLVKSPRKSSKAQSSQICSGTSSFYHPPVAIQNAIAIYIIARNLIKRYPAMRKSESEKYPFQKLSQFSLIMLFLARLSWKRNVERESKRRKGENSALGRSTLHKILGLFHNIYISIKLFSPRFLSISQI